MKKSKFIATFKFYTEYEKNIVRLKGKQILQHQPGKAYNFRIKSEIGKLSIEVQYINTNFDWV